MSTFLQRNYWPLLFFCSVAVILIHLNTGPIGINFFDAISDSFAARYSVDSMILQEIRLPRLIIAFCVGASLGISGSALQGLLKNPLAEPGLIGVSSFAALGSVIAIYTGLAGTLWFLLPVSGMLGALVSVLLIFFLAGKNASVTHLILAGVAINAVASSAIALTLNFAPNPYALYEIIYWLLGSVSNRSINDVWISLPFMLIGWVFLLRAGAFLNALSLGEETAQSLGFSLSRERFLLVIGVTLCVGASVAVSGSIGFIGLVIPHLLRPLVGYEPKKLLLLSAVAGGILLVLADITVQLLAGNQELKLGVITAMIGGPFFLAMIYRMRNEVY